MHWYLRAQVLNIHKCALVSCDIETDGSASFMLTMYELVSFLHLPLSVPQSPVHAATETLSSKQNNAYSIISAYITLEAEGLHQMLRIESFDERQYIQQQLSQLRLVKFGVDRVR